MQGEYYITAEVGEKEVSKVGPMKKVWKYGI